MFGPCERVIDMTLALFRDLTLGYMSGKLLSRLDAISFILTHHSPAHYPFLLQAGRNRTTFYATLARMVFLDDSTVKFKTFVSPLQQILDGLASAAGCAGGAAGSAAQLRASVPADTVSGLFRDLRGVAAASMCRRAYGLLFEWLYPAHFPVMLLCLQAGSRGRGPGLGRGLAQRVKG